MISSTTIVKGTTVNFTKSEAISSEYSFVDFTESHQSASDTHTCPDPRMWVFYGNQTTKECLTRYNEFMSNAVVMNAHATAASLVDPDVI